MNGCKADMSFDPPYIYEFATFVGRGEIQHRVRDGVWGTLPAKVRQFLNAALSAAAGPREVPFITSYGLAASVTSEAGNAVYGCFLNLAVCEDKCGRGHFTKPA
jgi:hypothetical protein